MTDKKKSEAKPETAVEDGKDELTSKEQRAGAELAPEPEAPEQPNTGGDESTDEADEDAVEDTEAKAERDEYDEGREAELVDYHQSYGDAVAKSNEGIREAYRR